MSQPFDQWEAKKELLMMKAQMERMELGMHVAQVRQSMTWLPMVQKLGGWLGRRNLNSLGPMGWAITPFIKKSLLAYPLLSGLASTALLRYRPQIASAGGKAAIAAVVLAAATYWFNTRGRKPRGG